MKQKTWFVIVSSVIAIMLRSPVSAQDYVDYVNPLTGTLSKYELSHGNTYPVIAMPWGMNFWTPQTGKMGDGWIYTYDNFRMRGIKQTHQPSPWINDYGQFSLMPVTGREKISEDQRASWFSHKAETAKPYYYSVYLAEHDVTAEVTPTERAAIFRFTFPESDRSAVVIDAFDNGSCIKIIPEERTVIGYTTKHSAKNGDNPPDNFRNWFVIRFDTPFDTAEVWDSCRVVPRVSELESGHVGAVIGFDTRKGQKVHARVASSFISLEQAYTNLKELDCGDFETVKERGRDRWNDILGRIRVEGDNADQLRTFYSCLYRSVLFPRKFYEIDSAGTVMHYSPYNGKVLPGYMYTDTGFWDTFRALMPLVHLVYPSVGKEIHGGLVNAFQEGGFLPEWSSPGYRNSMIGNNSAAVIADAAIKGINDEYLDVLYRAMLHGTDHVHPVIPTAGRLGHEYYNRLGYIPNNAGIRHSAARTLEYAYNDWCILQVALKLGRPEEEIRILERRSQNYRNLFNEAYGLMSGRDDCGVFDPEFDPSLWSDAFCEGNSWHWSFCVFHDPEGLIGLMGGNERFNRMMDSVFRVPGTEGIQGRRTIHEMREMQVMHMGQYAHGNQPIQHFPYLYNYCGSSWKAHYWIREVMDRLYSATPDGYCGDEDNGQTSAWYVFSSLGFYPLCPGSAKYSIGSPLFRKATVSLENGKQIVISAPDNNPENRYVTSLRLNGKDYGYHYFTYADLISGADIRIGMSSEPGNAENYFKLE